MQRLRSSWFGSILYLYPEAKKSLVRRCWIQLARIKAVLDRNSQRHHAAGHRRELDLGRFAGRQRVLLLPSEGAERCGVGLAAAVNSQHDGRIAAGRRG